MIMVSEHQLLLELLDHAFEKPSWHGPTLRGALRGVDWRTALKRPGKGRKCIWEQVLHAAYWKQRVLNKLVGTQPFPRPGSNWPPPPAKPGPAAWKADLQLLRTIHGRLRLAVSALSQKQLADRRRFIRGVAYHDVYHAGQIKLIRRCITGNRQ